jgi:O-antigen/teichoic acid export membrane protein
LGLIPSSFLDALFPELANVAGHHAGDEKLRSLYSRGRRLLWLLTPLIIVPFGLGAGMLIGVLYGQGAGVSDTVILFRLFLLAFPFAYLYLLNGHALYAAGRQRRVTVVVVEVTVVSAVCNALAVPLWSYWGAVGVSLASEFLLFVLLEWEVRRLFAG